MSNQPPSLQDPRTFAIIGAAYEVHRALGTGFLEVFYKDALEIEFGERLIPFERESPCRVEYKGRPCLSTAVSSGSSKNDLRAFCAVALDFYV